MKPITGLLTSQIGYDLGQPMRAVVRGPAATLPEAATPFTVQDARGNVVQTGTFQRWGELWGSHWWCAEFSGLDAGDYSLVLQKPDGTGWRSDRFIVGENRLWNETWFLSAIDQAERRQRLAKQKSGWYDAGAEWQEANSHASYLVGMCDLLEFVPEKIAEHRKRLEAQIRNGCDYLATLQDLAAKLPGGEGAVVHQVWRFDEMILPGDVSKAALAWARAARFLSDEHIEAKQNYLDRAERAMGWLRTATPLTGEKGFSRINHGVPADFVLPEEWMTRDLLMQCWAAFELAQAGRSGYQEECIALAEKIMNRQVPQETPEGELYGHFRTWDSAPYTERAWVHHGEGGYGPDCGGTFPHYILPLVQMSTVWSTHPQAEQWRQAVRKFAYGYFLPACRANPFLLLPLGYVLNEGLVWFAGLWHGMNAAYALAAALALEFERLFGDVAFRQVAIGNLQWIAGLNAGITAENQFAAHMFSMDVPEGVALPVSMMCGVGSRTAGNWMQIRGSICNGFSMGDQFTFDVPSTKANDGPPSFTDEDWITHAGGWLSALARLKGY